MTHPRQSTLTHRQMKALCEFIDAFGLPRDTEFIRVASDLLDLDLQPAQLVEVQRGPYPFVDLILTNLEKAA
jgi:hypothetical protein